MRKNKHTYADKLTTYFYILAIGVALRATPTLSWWGCFAPPKPPVRVSRYTPY